MPKTTQSKQKGVLLEYKDDFIMSPKVDFVFKLIFGDEKNKKLLISLLTAVLKLDIDEFEEIELVNTELLKQFKEDKKGILDVRVRTKHGKYIDIEIQILPTGFMGERSLFYWSKMYTAQISKGDTYDKLKKCIAINILDFIRIPGDKIHNTFHLYEDETRHKLTDVLEIHYLELPKLNEKSRLTDGNDPSLYWLEFINAPSKEAMELLAKNNEDIQEAYAILKRVSKSKSARMAYEARQAEIMDQMTREKSAREKGKAEGLAEGEIKGKAEGKAEGLAEGEIKGKAEGKAEGEFQKAVAVAETMIKDGLADEMIVKYSGLRIDEINKLKADFNKNKDRGDEIAKNNTK